MFICERARVFVSPCERQCCTHTQTHVYATIYIKNCCVVYIVFLFVSVRLTYIFAIIIFCQGRTYIRPNQRGGEWCVCVTDLLFGLHIYALFSFPTDSVAVSVCCCPCVYEINTFLCIYVCIHVVCTFVCVCVCMCVSTSTSICNFDVFFSSLTATRCLHKTSLFGGWQIKIWGCAKRGGVGQHNLHNPRQGSGCEKAFRSYQCLLRKTQSPQIFFISLVAHSI